MASKVNISDSILPGPNNKIGPGAVGIPSGPPAGYVILKEVTPEISSLAKSLLKGDYGTMTPFTIDGKKYIARVEPHYHPPDYKNGPKNWHKGVSVFIKEEKLDSDNKSIPSKSRLQLLQRIDNFLNGLK